MKTRLKIKPKSYKIISDLTEKQLKEYNITREEIDRVVAYQFDFILEYMRNPIKGRLYIEELGSFDLHVNNILRFLKSAIEKMREQKREGREVSQALIDYFRHWWPIRIIGVRFVSNDGLRKKGYYKPFNIIKNKLIPKKGYKNESNKQVEEHSTN
jgi:hypothetical protein